MARPLVLLAVAALGPAVAFGGALLLFRAIRLSGSPRGAQLLALSVAGAIQGALLAAAIATYGFAWQTFATLLVSTVFTGLGWSRFRRSFPRPSGPAPSSS